MQHRILAPWPGVEPVPSALVTWSLKHWTTREAIWLPWFLMRNPLFAGFSSVFKLFVSHHPQDIFFTSSFQFNCSKCWFGFLWVYPVCIHSTPWTCTFMSFAKFSKFLLLFLFFFKNIYLLIWLYQVFVAALGVLNLDRSMQHLFFFKLWPVGSSSLTRDWNQAPCIGSSVLTTGPPGKSSHYLSAFSAHSLLNS